MQSARELEGQVALVTGGGRGIGRLIARELADAGMRVAVAARSSGQVEETAKEIGGLAVTAAHSPSTFQWTRESQRPHRRSVKIEGVKILRRPVGRTPHLE